MNRIAILYQALAPVLINGARKPFKVGGYSDSGADIACELSPSEIITPVDNPKKDCDLDWVFPDTYKGIEKAVKKGATALWLNTVLFKGHPIEGFFSKDLNFIGQIPDQVGQYDDKFLTNKFLVEKGFLIPESVLLEKQTALETSLNMNFPLVLKPLRGRGSQGVVIVKSQVELENELKKYFSENEFDDKVYIENFLPGKEITITVMPPGRYVIADKKRIFKRPWSLPAVERFNHKKGIAPYSGLVAVIENSRVMSLEERNTDEIKAAYKQCEMAAGLFNIKAPIRIDCRGGENNKLYLFDLNFKPNMTGPSRPHHKNQDSLTLLAARELGWSYSDLLKNIANQHWRGESLAFDQTNQ